MSPSIDVSTSTNRSKAYVLVPNDGQFKNSVHKLLLTHSKNDGMTDGVGSPVISPERNIPPANDNINVVTANINKDYQTISQIQETSEPTDNHKSFLQPSQNAGFPPTSTFYSAQFLNNKEPMDGIKNQVLPVSGLSSSKISVGTETEDKAKSQTTSRKDNKGLSLIIEAPSLHIFKLILKYHATIS